MYVCMYLIFDILYIYIYIYNDKELHVFVYLPSKLSSNLLLELGFTCFQFLKLYVYHVGHIFVSSL